MFQVKHMEMNIHFMLGKHDIAAVDFVLFFVILNIPSFSDLLRTCMFSSKSRLTNY